jgi:2-polyprenyl-3-methyl-5-hydroxy-6-metoxy-1,4-benzoquinol methylase
MDRRKLQSARFAAREARRAWDAAIDVWEEFEERGLDYSREFVHGPALLRALGPVEGLSVLDVGCGQGRFTRTLAERGARVTAIDWSGPMLAAARRRERHDGLGIRYLRMDARSIGTRWKRPTFDRIVACMSLMDMPGLSTVLRGVRRALRSDGRLVFSISHPMNTAAVGWERASDRNTGAMRIDRYFIERVGVTEWRMARLRRPFDTLHWHRTLESWFGLLEDARFSVDRLMEPRATAAQRRANELLRGASTFPFFLVLGCSPTSPSAVTVGPKTHGPRSTVARAARPSQS